MGSGSGICLPDMLRSRWKIRVDLWSMEVIFSADNGGEDFVSGRRWSGDTRGRAGLSFSWRTGFGFSLSFGGTVLGRFAVVYSIGLFIFLRFVVFIRLF